MGISSTLRDDHVRVDVLYRPWSVRTKAIADFVGDIPLHAGHPSESALAEGSAERAVATYGGPFLDGFYLSDAPEFERWVERERRRLEMEAIAAAWYLADAAEADAIFASDGRDTSQSVRAIRKGPGC